jgi:SAM-dependent methyltransferase
MVNAIRFDTAVVLDAGDARPRLRGIFEVTAPIVFFPEVRVSIDAANGATVASTSKSRFAIGWLPRGKYRVELDLPPELPPGPLRFRMAVWRREGMADVEAAAFEGDASLGSAHSDPTRAWSWNFEALPPATPIASLAWNKGPGEWFFSHFDHAASIVMSYLLKDSPLLKGRILDVGCGDGVTDLSIALRTGCREFIGIDPFKGYERLPQILAANNLPADLIPPNLKFQCEDANYLPFPDDSFDVVISWGSVEHMAGGYLQALREVKRVLKPDGLFFVAPGLFYSLIGHHLGEFSDEPFFHLKKSREEIRRMVLETPPKYIDRAGEFASNEQYWQWFTELNPITVTEFEKELRALEFEPWCVALRTAPLIEYTPELQSYSIETLANTELYMSCVSRKKRR